mgnify:CR=1 FL=1|jgi:hypothetical protein
MITYSSGLSEALALGIVESRKMRPFRCSMIKNGVPITVLSTHMQYVLGTGTSFSFRAWNIVYSRSI